MSPYLALLGLACSCCCRGVRSVRSGRSVGISICSIRIRGVRVVGIGIGICCVCVVGIGICIIGISICVVCVCVGVVGIGVLYS